MFLIFGMFPDVLTGEQTLEMGKECRDSAAEAQSRVEHHISLLQNWIVFWWQVITCLEKPVRSKGADTVLM